LSARDGFCAYQQLYLSIHSGLFLFYMLTFLLLILIGLGAYLVTQYNQAQAKALTIEEAQSNITVTIKKRFDLINKLMDVVASYVDHEKLTHLAVVEGESMAKLAQASVRADQTVTQLNSLARAYPDLKANASYNRLMDSLGQIEDEVQARREGYNRVVRDYNTFCNAIPFTLVASSLGFQRAPFFDVTNADSLENMNTFSANDGTILREKFAQASTQVVEGTKALATTLETHGRALLNRSSTPEPATTNAGPTTTVAPSVAPAGHPTDAPTPDKPPVS
jgi:LemA protein